MSGAPGARSEWRAHWATVLAAMIGMSCTTLYVYSSGALMEPIERDTGWSRAQIGSGISVATTVAALLGPIMGAAVDRFGPRRLSLIGILIFCACFAALSLAGPTLWSWWLLWLLVGLGGFGVKPSVWTTAVASLFVASRGLALAVTLCGASLGAIVIPVMTTWLAGTYGWRGAYLGLALIWGAVVFPVLLFAFRDARSKAATDTADGRARAAAKPDLPGLSVRQSMLSRRYLALALAMLVFSFVSMSFIISMIPILTWQGLDRTQAAGLSAIIGVSAIIGRLGTGALIDRFDPRAITASAMMLPLVTALMLTFAPGSAGVAAAAILIMGLSLGAEIDAVAFMTGHYFGLRHYGLLFGTLISASAVATALAPLFAGYVFDSSGGYGPLLVAMMPLSVIAALLIASLGRPPDWSARP